MPGTSARSGVLGGLRGFVRFFRDVMGEDAYRKYREHHEASGCGSAPMSEREFWKDRFDRQDANPGGRCC